MDKSGKRNRFLDALAGRNVQEEPEKFPETIRSLWKKDGSLMMEASVFG